MVRRVVVLLLAAATLAACRDGGAAPAPASVVVPATGHVLAPCPTDMHC